MANIHNYSIIPPSAVFGDDWPSYSNITQGYRGALSVAGWTSGNEGYIQQTFLGASIRSFNINAGFGDTSSTMGIELVNDEFNKSDTLPLGYGDDVYHNGKYDEFAPPVVGSPVFFKFGKNHATIEQAFRKDFDQIYGMNTLQMPADPFPTGVRSLPFTNHPDGLYVVGNPKTSTTTIDKRALLDPNTKWRGFAHFTFGGILQSYTENRSNDGNPLYSVKLVDPREILSNVELILNNYQGTTFNNKNLLNIYGFLEYDPSDKLTSQLDSIAIKKSILTKEVNLTGNITYIGTDEYIFEPDTENIIKYKDGSDPSKTEILYNSFPITGQGFSRRSENGIPFYRIKQALNSLLGLSYNNMPYEYKEAGFGGVIDFRGYNYVIDLGGIPIDEIPLSYFFDFDKISLLDFIQELCDILSRDLFVSLLPVIDHPACQNLFNKNQSVIKKADTLSDSDRPSKQEVLGKNLVAGIIRIDTIDKRQPPDYGAIKNYLNELELKNIFVQSRDVGFELSNVTTDKFIVGGQEVEMYYFNGLRDRDNYLERLKDTGNPAAKQSLEQLNHDKWTIETNQNQQILPFYGFIGDKAVTIPRGFGSYQQILLDTRHLDAHGVGAYYVATEMELRAASISFEQWSKFLVTYNELYIQELNNTQIFLGALGANFDDVIDGINNQLPSENSDLVKSLLETLTNRTFGVSVPRCVWNSDKSPENSEDSDSKHSSQFKGKMGADGYPASPCSPPFGYPLYYKRAEKIGIPQAGLTQMQQSINTVITNIENLENLTRSDKQRFSYIKSKARSNIKRLQDLILEKEKSLNAIKLLSSEEIPLEIMEEINILKQRILEIESNLEKQIKDIQTLSSNKNIQIAQLKTIVKNSAGIIKNMNKYSRDSINNAKKVYNFIKKIADENLGKKFLIKIPRACNVNWSKNIKLNSGKAWDIIEGPFGFKPQPISSSTNYIITSEWSDQLKDFKLVAKTAEIQSPHWHYLDVDAMGMAAFKENSKNLVHYGSGYTYGALKCNFNPITDKWEYNYKPEPQGGFPAFELHPKNLIKGDTKSPIPLTPLVNNLLAPELMDKLIESNGRIQCYVRYDHSQHLDFSNINSSDIEQQIIQGNIIIPDVMETLPNLNPDRTLSLDRIQARLQDDELLERQPESVAFVKCSIDENLYMSPKVVYSNETQVWAEDFTVAVAPAPYEIIYVEDPDTKCKIPKTALRRPVPVFGVKDGGLLSPPTKVKWDDFDREYSKTYNGWIVKTREKDLDPSHVYAIITVPGRVIPTVDKRYVDGPLKSINGVSLANTFTEDTVKIDEFKKPGNTNPPTTTGVNLCNDTINFKPSDIGKALEEQRNILKSLSLSSDGNNSILAFTSPSPVYPDLVAIPLMSMERCYGPWLSSAMDKTMADGTEVRYSDIGGKIEFDKKEDLVPWNFAGYQLMDEAGKLHSKFSNSLLLFSERGSFTYESAPIDISLGKALQSMGPLVTSINVDVNNKITTTVRLDLYTAQFGKLQKQKEIAIAQISRERQKILDQMNLLRRRGIGKGSANMDMLGGLLRNGGKQIIDAARASQDMYTALEKGDAAKASMISISVIPNEQQFDNFQESINTRIPASNFAGIIQTDKDLMELQSLFITDADYKQKYMETAGGYIADIFKGVSEAPFDNNFASTKPDIKHLKDRRTQ